MSDDRVQLWLERKLAREARGNVLLALVLLLGAAAVLAFTFAGAYTMSFFVFWRVLHLHLNACFWIAVGVIVLLFIANAFTDREKLTEYQVETMDGGPVQTFYLPHLGIVSNINPFSAETMSAGVKIIADLVLTGPRLVSAAGQAFQRSRRLRRMDVRLVAHVFTQLLGAGRRVSLAEILPQLGHGDPAALFRQLQMIEGVVFLNSPPPGISLTADLRAEFFEELKSGQ